jgi:putative ABC transport system ATP-binding protein
MMAAPPVIALDAITKTYGKGDSEVRALAGASLVVEPGEFVALMGASGSGKSTFLNVIGCLDVPTGGRYLFHGVDVRTLSRNELARLRRHYLGFVFQRFELLGRTSAVENVELPLIYRRVPSGERRRRALQALSEVGLLSHAAHTPAEMSGGQQQRVAIARALVGEPQVLLADEPTGNLDSRRKREVMELLVQLTARRGLTLVMVTHEPEMAEFADRVVHFHDGVIEREERRAR